jgi:hypothetical protein
MISSPVLNNRMMYVAGLNEVAVAFDLANLVR